MYISNTFEENSEEDFYPYDEYAYEMDERIAALSQGTLNLPIFYHLTRTYTEELIPDPRVFEAYRHVARVPSPKEPT